jgi:hypothetical protein
MRQVFKSLGLLLLLITAQQGALVHDFEHVARLTSVGASLDSALLGDAACALCPAYAQAASAAFSHAFPVLQFGRVPALGSVPFSPAAILAALPTPRNRGPPSLS